MGSSLFIVRVWRERARRGAGAFRACVRAVDAEQAQLFTRPAELVRFLVDHGRSAALDDHFGGEGDGGNGERNECD